MANIGSLFFLLRGEDKQLQVDAKKAGEAAGAAAGLAASQTLGSSFKKGLPGALSSFGTGIAQGMGQQAWRGIESAINGVVSAIPDLIEKGKQYGLLVDDIADATGASAESASRLAGSLMALGIPTAGLSGNFRILSKEIVTNEDAFRKLGIATRDANGVQLDTVTILDNVRSYLSGMGDGADKAALATKLLGRSALDLIDYLNLTDAQAGALTERLQKMGLIVGEEFRVEAEKAKRETALLDLAFTGLGVTLQAEVGPIVRRVISGITEWIIDNAQTIKTVIADVANFIAGAFSGLFGGDFSAITTFADSLGDLGNAPVTAVQSLNGELADLNAARADLVANAPKVVAGTNAETGAIDRQTAAIDKQIAAVEKKDAADQRAYEKSMGRLGAELDAQLALMDAQERAARDAADMQSAEVDIAAAQEALRKERAKGATGQYDAAAVAAAQADLDRATAARDALRSRQEADRKRAGIEEAKKYVADLADLEKNTDNRKALDKTLHRRQTALEEQLAAAQARGDTEAVALLTTKLEAVKTTEVRNQAALRNATRKSELEKAKAELAEMRKAITSSIGGGSSEAQKKFAEELAKIDQKIAETRAILYSLTSGVQGNDARKFGGGAGAGKAPLGSGGADRVGLRRGGGGGQAVRGGRQDGGRGHRQRDRQCRHRHRRRHEEVRPVGRLGAAEVAPGYSAPSSTGSRCTTPRRPSSTSRPATARRPTAAATTAAGPSAGSSRPARPRGSASSASSARTASPAAGRSSRRSPAGPWPAPRTSSTSTSTGARSPSRSTKSSPTARADRRYRWQSRSRRTGPSRRPSSRGTRPTSRTRPSSSSSRSRRARTRPTATRTTTSTT